MRPLKQRVSYHQDAAHITRVAKAIEEDPRIPPPLKRSITECTSRLTAMLLLDCTYAINDGERRAEARVKRKGRKAS